MGINFFMNGLVHLMQEEAIPPFTCWQYCSFAAHA